MTDQELRLECMKLAIAKSSNSSTDDKILDTAQMIYDFIANQKPDDKFMQALAKSGVRKENNLYTE